MDRMIIVINPDWSVLPEAERTDIVFSASRNGIWANWNPGERMKGSLTISLFRGD
jgi:hypothetical protein